MAPSPASTHGVPSRWRRFVNLVAPGPLAGQLLLTGLAVEACLQMTVRGMKPEWTWLSTALLWTWLTIVWSVWGLAQMLRASDRSRFRGLRAVVVGLTVLPLLAGAMIYAASWAFYLRVGMFGGVETLEFAVENAKTTWFWAHMFHVEFAAMCLSALTIVLALVVLPRLLRWIGNSTWGLPVTWKTRRLRALVWLLPGLALLVGWKTIDFEPGAGQRQFLRSLRTQRSNPLLTHVIGVRDWWKMERIELCLPVSDLTPLASRTPAAPTRVAAGDARPLSVIFISVESLRHDVVLQIHQGQEVTPHINELARNGRQMTRAYAQSTHSDYSEVTTVTGLYPLRSRRHHYYRVGDPWPVTRIYDILHPLGYATAHISSQNDSWGGMSNLLASPHLDMNFDADQSSAPKKVPERDTGLASAVKRGQYRGGILDDAETMNVATDWVRRQAAVGKPFFLNMILQNSHFPHDIAPESPHPFQPCTIDFEASFIRYPEDKKEIIRNAYFNSLHSVDHEIGRLTATLRELGRLDDTIFVVYGDNGECFFEHGQVTHAREPYDPAIHVGCVIHAPRKLTPAKEDYPCELIDLPSTVLGLLDLPPHSNFQGIDVFSPNRPPLERRQVFSHVETPLAKADSTILAGRWKFMLDRGTGREYLFDLETDPEEEKNLLEQEPERAKSLRESLLSWRRGQLAYYFYSYYYKQYFPPVPSVMTRLGEMGLPESKAFAAASEDR